MDREAWGTTVPGVASVRHDWATNTSTFFSHLNMLDNVRTINRVYSRVLIFKEHTSYISIHSRDNLQNCYQEDLWIYLNLQDPKLCCPRWYD